MIPQNQGFDYCDTGMLEKFAYSEVFAVTVRGQYRERDLSGKHDEGDDMGQIQLPNTSIYLCHRKDLAVVPHGPSIDNGSGITRNENEDLGSICECERLEGEV